MKIKQVLNRFYVPDIEQAIAFYEKIVDEKCILRFKNQEFNLEIAQVGYFLLISGPDESLKPLEATKATFLIDNIMDFKDFLLNAGAVVVREASTGNRMTIKHPDGIIVEYVEQKNMRGI